MASTGEPFGLFWNSENGDRTYDASSFEYWLKKFFTSGVFNGDLQVLATSGMTLKVGPGYANIDGKVRFWNAEFNLTLSPANSTYPRIDTVVITRDNVNRNITCEVVTGQYSGDTPQPTAPVRTAEIYQLVLAQIYVGNGVTEITQANITDTRPDPNLCGYIVGTVTEMDFSQFTAQFESYFAQFKSQHEHEWSVWEQTQVAAYAAWFANVQAQQIADKADWDQWYADLQEELHMLTADSAEYLQIQIDEIRENGTTGSIFHITTINSELEGKTVTVSCGTEVRTATFDENLECSVVGFKSVGAVTITSTDGIQTATSIVNIDYYSKYEIPIAFWLATVNIQGDDNLKGATITVKDSDNQTVGTVVLNVITGRGVFNAQKADTYTFNFTYQGTDYSESLVVDEETTYSLSLSAGFNWHTWVDTARFLDSSDYANLDEVLADEEAVRELCLEHNCVDYFCDISSVNNDVETIINNDLFAKWANNSDYALDNMYANAAIKTAMDTADKYGYGEWVITDDTTTPPTWGAKGNVPIMTSNSAPYGTVNSISEYQTYSAWKVFDGDKTTHWMPSENVSPGATQTSWVQYKFTNPIKPKRFKIFPRTASGTYSWRSIEVLGSNDGINFVSIYSDNTTRDEQREYALNIDSDNYYLYLRLKCTVMNNHTVSTSVVQLFELQFYGRELSVSVPKMATNTTPYGEVSASSAESNYPAYKVFDEDNSSYWSSTGPTNQYVGYSFTSKTKIEKVKIIAHYASVARLKNFKIQAKDSNNDWVDIYDGTYPNTADYVLDVAIDSNEAYTDFRLFAIDTHNSSNYVIIKTLQFFGKDYSEKEFEEGTTKKWLYDHGVELESIVVSGVTTEKTSDYIKCTGNNSGTNANIQTQNTFDYTNYKLQRAHLTCPGDNVGFHAFNSGGTSLGYTMIRDTQPYNSSHDVTAINENAKPVLDAGGNGVYIILTELWLE